MDNSQIISQCQVTNLQSKRFKSLCHISN